MHCELFRIGLVQSMGDRLGELCDCVDADWFVLRCLCLGVDVAEEFSASLFLKNKLNMYIRSFMTYRSKTVEVLSQNSECGRIGD